jgi:hypothetical protein
MKYLKYLALVSVLMIPLAYSQAQVRFGVNIGVGPGYVSGPPACAYGYYSDYPYGCAPYGFYGPSYFVNGIFIGAGPWYHSNARPNYGRPYYGRPYVGRSFQDRGFDNRRFDDRRIQGRDRDDHRSFDGRGPSTSFHGGSSHGNSSHGNSSHGSGPHGSRR